MDANKIRVVFDNQAKDIVLPLEQIWDFGGNQDAIEQYETSIIEKILNFPNSAFTDISDAINNAIGAESNK
ncbi:MAG: hypothetical protein EBS55_05680, partial [Flavobacteriaceae bacterium]|nr:hypothetical protein [Flavobacteriaceae bacterium]